VAPSVKNKSATRRSRPVSFTDVLDAQERKAAKTRSKEPKPSTNLALRTESIRLLTNAAFRWIVSHGYHATTLSDVAKAAGLTKGAIFFYFSSKEKMILHLLDVAEANTVDPLIARIEESSATAPEKIADFFRYSSQHGIDRPQELLCLIKISVEFRNRGDVIDQRITQIYDRMYDCLEKLLDDGVLRGELADSTPVRELASMIIATHDGMMLEWYRHKPQIDGGKLVRTVMKVFTSGTTTEPALRRRDPAHRLKSRS
jgi:TetR/AcrR family transcriptional regulator, transcriptional repressor for nem operon